MIRYEIIVKGIFNAMCSFYLSFLRKQESIVSSGRGPKPHRGGIFVAGFTVPGTSSVGAAYLKGMGYAAPAGLGGVCEPCYKYAPPTGLDGTSPKSVIIRESQDEPGIPIDEAMKELDLQK